jgi:hypothetical protein
MFKIVQTSWTMASHCPHCHIELTAELMWWQVSEKKSWNCRHKALFTNQYRTSPTVINRMLLKGLVKAKNLATSRTCVMDLEIWPISIGGYTWKSCGKLLVESLRSKRSHKCSKTIFKGSPVEWCDNRMKTDLKKSKENSKFESSWKHSKEFQQGEDKCGRWNT